MMPFPFQFIVVSIFLLFFTTRLVRVRQCGTQNEPSCSDPGQGECVALFEDYAVDINSELVIARVQRMRKKGKNQGFVEYKKPVKFSDIKELLFNMTVYDMAENHQYSLGNSVVEVSGKKIISPVSMYFQPEANIYTLNEDSFLSIQNAFNHPYPNPCPIRVNEQIMEDDGCMKTVVNPQEAPEGIRRSARKRTVISHLY